MGAVLLSSRKAVSVGPPMTIDKKQDVENEPWYRNPWVWLIIAIPALTVIAGLLTLYLAIANSPIMVSDAAPQEQSTNRTT